MLGLLINLMKSQLVATQSVHLMGAHLDSVKGMTFLCSDRGKAIKSTYRVFLDSQFQAVQCSQHFLGMIAATTAIVPHSNLLMRGLHYGFCGDLTQCYSPREHVCPSKEALRALG